MSQIIRNSTQIKKQRRFMKYVFVEYLYKYIQVENYKFNPKFIFTYNDSLCYLDVFEKLGVVITNINNTLNFTYEDEEIVAKGIIE